MDKHPVVTADSPQNLTHGIMICGYNFGFSMLDQKNEGEGSIANESAPSFFSDLRVNDTLFRNRLLRWFDSWGRPLETDPDKISQYEQSIFQTNWLGTRTNTAADDNINVDKLVSESEGIVSLIESRKPRLIIFTGSSLIEALNDIQIRDRVESTLGLRPGNAEIFTSETPSGGVKFKLLLQRFPHTTVVSLPHATGARGLSDDYIAGFRGVMHDLLR